MGLAVSVEAAATMLTSVFRSAREMVVVDGPVLVFVEVRARKAGGFGGAAESITATKQARVILAARHYLARHGLDVPCRFDAVLLDDGDLSWIRNAFEA